MVSPSPPGFKIELPAFEGPYLTADADFLGSKVEAEVIARYLHGTTKAPAPDDPTPNTAIVEFTGERGEKLLIDMLIGVLGVPTPEARKLAVPVELAGCEPIQVLHPLLVLESRCHNLECLSHNREGNGITQARVACQVVTRYLADSLAKPARRREALDAAGRIANLAKSSAGVFVWTQWNIDVLATIDPAAMPGEFPRSWKFEIERVNHKREVALRSLQNATTTSPAE